MPRKPQSSTAGPKDVVDSILAAEPALAKVPRLDLEIIALYAFGMTVSSIREITGRSKERVEQAIKMYGNEAGKIPGSAQIDVMMMVAWHSMAAASSVLMDPAKIKAMEPKDAMAMMKQGLPLLKDLMGLKLSARADENRESIPTLDEFKEGLQTDSDS